MWGKKCRFFPGEASARHHTSFATRSIRTLAIATDSPVSRRVSLLCPFTPLTLLALATPPQVIPSLQGDASSQSPPDLPSFIFKERIVYLGMTLVPSVAGERVSVHDLLISRSSILMNRQS